jgi:hypothetical protein
MSAFQRFGKKKKKNDQSFKTPVGATLGNMQDEGRTPQQDSGNNQNDVEERSRDRTLAAGVANSTKAMPLRDSVSRSTGRRTLVMSPHPWKNSVNDSLAASSPWYLSKPFTKMVVPS